MAKEIQLSQGFVAIVDDEDYLRTLQYKWCAQKSKCSSLVYAIRTVVWESEGRRRTTTQRLHRFILGVTDAGIDVDHINGNGLDNRKSNLRQCRHSENMRNQRKRLNRTSTFKGVCWNRQNNNWRVRIRVGGKNLEIGSFQDEYSAAKAYDAAALKYFGEFAKTNFEKEAA